MKTILIYLGILTISVITVFSAPLQADPDYWTKLDYMLRGTVPFRFEKEGIEVELSKWDTKILVTLKGNYTNSDSLELDNVIQAFNEVLPNPGIGWGNEQNTSLVIQFSDLYEVSSLHQLNSFSNPAHNDKFLNHRFKIKKVKEAVLIINNKLAGEKRQKNIWGSFAKVILECNGFGYNSGSETVLGGKIRNLTDFDRFFFRTIYADNFTDQYLKFLKEKYGLFDQYRYLTDNNTRNTILFTLQLILMFLLTYFSYQFLWVKYLEKNTKGKFARFHISGLIFFTPQIIVSLPFITLYIIKLQHFSVSLLPALIVGIIGFVLLLAIYFIFALLTYFIEHILFGTIENFRQRQIVRIFSALVIISPIISIYLTINSPQILNGISIITIILSFGLIIVIRFLHFHNEHQKEIIRKHQQIKINKLEQLQTKFQLEAIQARTNPHFLHNTLNTIASLAQQDPAKAEDFAIKLSRLLRLRLNENTPPELPISKELETIQIYLEIEKERFFDRLDYTITVQDDARNIKIPSDILLYLVENSIKHGISKQTGKGKLCIEITTTHTQVKMCVSDNGPDFPENPIYGTGLKSILEKLDILYPENYEFAIFHHPNKRVEIKFQKA